MAELLAVAGGISSFITIAEVSLHLVQGCRQLIRDAKDAPKEVRKLVEELENLSSIAEGIERIVRETENEELRTKVDKAVRAPMERCVGVVDGLKRILAEYESGFQKAGAKLWWEKVKAVKGKKGILKFLDEIERTKLALVLAHQNAAGMTMQSQTFALGEISQSVGLIQSDNLAISIKIDNSNAQGKEVLTVAKATQQHLRDSEIHQREDSERQKTIQAKLEENSESQNQSSSQVFSSLERVHDSNMSLSAKMDDSFSQGETILTITKRSEETMHQSGKSRREDSERLRTMERQLEQLSSVIGNSGMLVGLVTEALDTHDRKRQRSRMVELEPDINDEVPRGKNDSSAVERSMPNGRRRARWKPVTYKRHLWNRYLDISSTTREQISDEDDSTEELGPPKRTETTFRVMWKLPFSKRALDYTTYGTSWDPLYETKVRYTRVFTEDSTIWQACVDCDLDEVRRLFSSGEASPFMEDEWGHSLTSQVIVDIVDREDQIKNNDIQLVDYLIRICGRGGASVRPYAIWDMIYERYHGRHPSKWNYLSSEEGGISILRLVVEYSREDPLDIAGISLLIDLDNSQDPMVTALIQQPFWSINLRPAIDWEGVVEENSRQMLDDPEGVYLRELLEDAYCYKVRTLEEFGKAFAGLFELATQSTTGNGPVVLRECCKNRMKLLISTPKYHQLLDVETLDFEDVASIRLNNPRHYPHHDVYVGGCAIRHGYRPLLEGIFRELGWSIFDIDDFFDKETFHCVPGLLDGEINYKTSQQMQQEFILNLCDGAFTGMSKKEIELLSYQISYATKSSGDLDLYKFQLEPVIQEANMAFISKKTPGSWPEEDEIKLVPGVDFVVREDCKKYIFSWYRDYVDPNFEFELSD